MIQKSFVSHKSVIIPAGEGRSVVENVTGNFFICKESSAAFEMTLDNGEKFDFEAGLSFELEPGDLFKRITFTNPSDTEITLEFYAAVGKVKDSRFNNLLTRNITIQVISAPTRVVATEDGVGLGLTLSANETVTIPGTNAGQTRVDLTLTNMSEDDDLIVLDASGEWIGTVFPRSAWTKAISFTVKLKNLSTAAGDLICTVLEQYPE